MGIAPKIAWALLCLGFLGSTTAFLPTKLNYSDPIVDEVFCPDKMTGPTWDLKQITREALRREVRLLFLDDPPTREFTLPEDATLIQLFKLYYGDSASPVRFYKAVNDIAWANALVDSTPNSKYDPKYHFEAEDFNGAHQLLAARYNGMVNSILKNQEYGFARELLGLTLHAVQDFYSYSTWIELGNSEPLPSLGQPGCDFGETAGPGDAVCTDCPPSGGCTENVIIDGKLSSGYYNYDSEDGGSYIVDKPDSVGKCSHGGTLDTSAIIPASGGINKATTSPCYSPHHNLHQKAVDMAIASSEEFLGSLRTLIGNEEFKKLLDLYRGAALSIVIDKTDSMSLEIDQVKDQTHQIVEKSNPELLILVPYGDPYEEDTETITTDSEVFLAAVDALRPEKACCCVQEPVWHALDVAVQKTPEYSTVYLFTDAGGNDADLMPGVVAKAEDKHIKITIIYSTEVFGRTDPPCQSPTTNVSDYRNLASMTGGQFVEIDKVDIDSIIDIIDGGAEESKAYIRLMNGVTGQKTSTFPIEETISSMEVFISGETTSAVLTGPKGTVYDLMDESELGNHNDVNVKVFSSGVKKIEFIISDQGHWTLELDSVESYDVSVTSISQLDFLAAMTELDTIPPRPNYHLIEEKPIVGHVYYVEIMLVGWIETLVRDVTEIKFVDEKGDLISVMPYRDSYVDDEIYIQSTPLPDQDFFIIVNGHLSSDNDFSRIFPIKMNPVDISLNVDLSTSDLEGPPGSTKYAYFTVTNLGIQDDFTFNCEDELNFARSVLPHTATMPRNGAVEVKITFIVPHDATPYDVSRFTFTAANSLASSSALNNFLVVPKDIDSTAPTCTIVEYQLCESHSTADTCSDGKWIGHAVLQDDMSGLYTVTANPEASLIVTGLTNATNDEVYAEYEASCCVRQAQVIGIDGQGNMGTCDFDLEDLITIPPTTTPPSTTTTPPTEPPTTTTPTTEPPTTTTPTTEPPPTTTPPTDSPPITTTGDSSTLPSVSDFIIEFVAIDKGSTWVHLKWTVVAIRQDLSKYSLVTDDILNTDRLCNELVCYYNVTHLDPCQLHQFTLTPHFFGSEGKDEEGDTVYEEATTLEDEPETPTNPHTDAVNTEGVTVSWDAPAAINCVQGYRVCYFMLGFPDDTICEDSDDTTHTLVDLEACTVYFVDVFTISNSGAISEPLRFDTNSVDAVPGKPLNLEVANNTLDGVVCITWDGPLVNKYCANSYSISYIDNSEFTYHRSGLVRGEFSSCMNEIVGCSNYTFAVSSLSPSGHIGGTAIVHEATPETEPTPVSSVDTSLVTTNSMQVSWQIEGRESCIDHYKVCVLDYTTFTKRCENTQSLHHNFDGLSACETYEVTAESVSPSGHRSHAASQTTKTDDDNPGTPTNVQVSEQSPYSLTISFEDTTVNPACSFEYDISVRPDETFRELIPQFKSEIGVTPYTTAVVNGLSPCVLYDIDVFFKSATGLTGPPARVQSTTTSIEPSVPSSFDYLDFGQSYVTVEWFAPAEGRHCVEKYVLSWSGANGDSGSQDFVTQMIDVEATIDGLTACTDYTFTVVAVTHGATFTSDASQIQVKTSC